MISGKLAWFIVVQLTIFKGCCCSNTTQTVKNEEAFPRTTPPAETPLIIADTPPNENANGKIPEVPETTNSSTNGSHLEIVEIFQGNPNVTTTTSAEQITVVNTTITNCLNISSVNVTCMSWNDTFRTNYTTVAEAVGASESFPERLENTAAITAGIFLVSAVIGYFSCVGYRRFLQRKYGNSQILIGEEVYDTADLRYFEI